MIKRCWNCLPPGLKFLFKTYLSAIAAFTIFRTILLFVGIKQLAGVPADDIVMAYVNGWRFDTVITGYILILPMIFTMLIDLIFLKHIIYKRIVLILLSILMCGAFLVCTVDIPYYFIFNSRITASLFNWFSSPKIVVNFLLEGVDYYIYTVLFIVFCIMYVRFLVGFYRTWAKESLLEKRPRLWGLKFSLIFIIACVFLFAGIRGKIFTRRPIAWAEAFTSVHNFPNQLGLNPLFMLGSSLTGEQNQLVKIQLMDDNEAVTIVQNYLNISPDPAFSSPIARQVTFSGEPKKYNVVLIVMESMTRANEGEKQNYNPPVTPFLDSIRDNSISFTNTYSLGIHTYNGIWSVFTSNPSPPTEDNPLQYYDNAYSFSGVSQTLRDNGYITHFSCPHDINFDNMGGFLSSNGFEVINGLTSEFLNDEFINVWGISDHLLFDRALPEINKLAEGSSLDGTRTDGTRPFFSTILTVSNHSPFNIPDPYPEGFVPKYTEKRQIAIEYADWSVKRFMEQAQKASWYDNTIFVFVSDHGANVFPNYEVNLNYNQVQMFFYAPKLLGPPKRIDNFALQLDLFPTLMDILNISYINNTMGIDLFHEKREAVYFSANSTIAAANDSLLLIRRDSGEKTLFKYNDNNLINLVDIYPDEALRLEQLALANFQTSIWLVKSGKGKPEKK